MTYHDVFDALGDPTRRSILEHLRAGPHPVGALARGLPVSRPAVSQHLRVLREAGLVSVRQDGTRRLYAINPAGPALLRAYADHLWDVALARFKEAAERGETEGLTTERTTGRRGAPRHTIARKTTPPRRRGPGFGRRKR